MNLDKSISMKSIKISPEIASFLVSMSDTEDLVSCKKAIVT